MFIAPIVLQEGTATFSQSVLGLTSPDYVYDGILTPNNGWAILRDVDEEPTSTVDEIAVWETAVDLAAGPITLRSFFSQHCHD